HLFPFAFPLFYRLLHLPNMCYAFLADLPFLPLLPLLPPLRPRFHPHWMLHLLPDWTLILFLILLLILLPIPYTKDRLPPRGLPNLRLRAFLRSVSSCLVFLLHLFFRLQQNW